MRGILVSGMVFSLSACAVLTESGTEEAVLFSGNSADNVAAAKPQGVLKPHEDMPLSVQFSCPTKIHTAMTSVTIPLPPVVPVEFVNDHVSYVHVDVPPDAQNAVPRMRIEMPQGKSIQLSDTPQSTRPSSDGKSVKLIYALQDDCQNFDGAVLHIAGFSYKDRNYPETSVRLHFKSKLKSAVTYGRS